MNGRPALNLSGELHLSRRLLPLRSAERELESCSGAACASMLLEYHALLGSRTEDDVGMILNTKFASPYAETHPDRMIEFLRSEGLSLVAGESGDIELIYDAIDAGMPVLVLHSSEGGGWRLAVGYEMTNVENGREEGNIFLTGPEGIASQDARRFYSRWHESRLFERTRERFYVLATP